MATGPSLGGDEKALRRVWRFRLLVPAPAIAAQADTAMSGRRNHTTMGLAFVLVCLIIAFGIFLALKNSPSESTSATAANVQIADNAASANTASADAANGLAPSSNDANLPSGGEPDGAQGAVEVDQKAAPGPSDILAPVPEHQAFYEACARSLADDAAPSAMCECVYDRLVSYKGVNADKLKLASNLCRLEAVTNPDRFRNDYEPTDMSAPSSDQPDGSVAQSPQAGGQP